MVKKQEIESYKKERIEELQGDIARWKRYIKNAIIELEILGVKEQDAED